MPGDERIRMALVGCGNIARAHWRGISRLVPEIEVSAIVDANPARSAAMAERTGGTPYASLTEALSEGALDAVDIMLPHDVHEAAAREAFAAGKHVVLEKPMAPDLETCGRILEAAERAGTVFMIAEQSQYWPDVLKVRELLQARAIGDVVAVRAFFFDPLVRDPNDPIPWRFRLARAGGGICIDGGAHWIRPLRVWFGEVDEVIATTSRQIPEMEGESQAHALLRFENGTVATFDALLSEAPTGPTEDFRITGSAGEVVIPHGPDGQLTLFNSEHPDGQALMPVWPGKVDSFGFELQDFVSAVLQGTPLAASPEYSLGELRTALAMYRSVESGRWEKVWD